MITNVLLAALILAVVAVATMLSRGFSSLSRRLDESLRASVTPTVSVVADVENTVAIVNVGSGTAIDVVWNLSSNGESGLIPYLSPQQSWHVQLSDSERGELSVAYKSVSGEAYTCTFDVTQITTSESRLVLA